MLKCPLVQRFAALFLSHFEMFSSREKKTTLVFGLLLNSNSSVQRNNITNEAGQLFAKYSICMYSIHGNKAWFSLFETFCSLPAPSCSQWQMLFSKLHLSHFVLENREDIEIHWLLSSSAFQYVFCIMRAQILLALLML